MKKIYMQPTAKTVKLNNQVILAGSGPIDGEGEYNLPETGEDITNPDEIATKKAGSFVYEW